jgi:hypothetical protein
MLGLAKSHIGPGFSGISRFVYTITIGDRALAVILASADPDNIRITRVDSYNAD